MAAQLCQTLIHESFSSCSRLVTKINYIFIREALKWKQLNMSYALDPYAKLLIHRMLMAH